MDDAAPTTAAPATAPRPTRLRRPTIVQAPMLLGALITGGVTVASVLWGFHEGNERGAGWWIVVLTGAVLTAGGLAAVRGCFVEVAGDGARDVVAWVTVHRFDPRRVRTARVARGVWRLFVLELDDGRRVTLVGSSPQQWPARLLPESRARDLADLDVLLGEPGDRTDGSGPAGRG